MYMTRVCQKSPEKTTGGPIQDNTSYAVNPTIEPVIYLIDSAEFQVTEQRFGKNTITWWKPKEHSSSQDLYFILHYYKLPFHYNLQIVYAHAVFGCPLRRENGVW